MQRPAGDFGQAPVQHLPDELLAEAQLRAVAGEDAQLHPFPHAVDEVERRTGTERGGVVHGDRFAEHGGDVEQPSRGGRKLPEPVRHRVDERIRQVPGDQVGDAVAEFGVSGLPYRIEQLRQQQRVSPGAPRQGQHRGTGVLAELVSAHLCDLGTVQRCEPDRVGAIAQQPVHGGRSRRRARFGAARDQPGYRAVCQGGHQDPQGVRGDLVGPVGVVEQHQHGPLGGPFLKAFADPVDEQQPVGRIAREFGHVGHFGTGQNGRIGAPERVQQRRKRCHPVEFGGVSVHDGQPRVVSVPVGGGQQPGLADARRSGHHDRAPATPRGRGHGGERVLACRASSSPAAHAMPPTSVPACSSAPAVRMA